MKRSRGATTAASGWTAQPGPWPPAYYVARVVGLEPFRPFISFRFRLLPTDVIKNVPFEQVQG